jgi:hypothetical protein
MKRMMMAALAAFLCLQGLAQKANMTWGDEFKLRKGSTDLEVIFADKTGVFVKESHYALKTYFVIGASTRESATLIKLDKDLTEQYRSNFDKELKGKEYESFFFLKGKLFLLATDYSKKTKTLTLFAAEVDKNSGELAGDWTEVTAWEKDDKKEDISFKAVYNYDSSKMVLVSTIEGREKNNYEVRQFNERLQSTDKAIAITNEFDPKTFQLEDVIYTANGNVVLVGREYEYQEGKKKKDKFLDFKNYNVRVYNGQGQMVKEINTAIDGKWLVTTKVMQMLNKELILAAFYSNQKRGKEVNGMLIQRINPVTGDIVTASQKELNTGLIEAVEEDKGDDNDDDETKKERKERERLEKIQDEGEAFSRYMRFRNFVPTTDNGVVILAEKYNSYSYTTTSYQGGFGNSPGRWTTTTYQVYECGDVFMSKMNTGGNIDWLHVVPKQQREVIQGGSTSHGNGLSLHFNFFRTGFNWPFYAGYGVLPGNNSLSIVFNDHKKNAEVLQPGQKVKRASYFRKSDCFAIQLNTLTGKYSRSYLFSNNDVPTAMPRLGSVLGNQLYMVGKEDRLLGKTKIAIGKLTIK